MFSSKRRNVYGAYHNIKLTIFFAADTQYSFVDALRAVRFFKSLY